MIDQVCSNLGLCIGTTANRNVFPIFTPLDPGKLDMRTIVVVFPRWCCVFVVGTVVFIEGGVAGGGLADRGGCPTEW